MKHSPRSPGSILLVLIALCSLVSASAYNAHPKLVVIVLIDQFRGDYLERYRAEFGEGGFRLFLDHGAVFTDCNYDYANTRTSPGHATLLTGAYSNGHGIISNEWWDPQKKAMVGSVADAGTRLLGVTGTSAGSSPHNLRATTLGDELKLATGGKSRVFGVSLKERAAVLPAGFAGDGAYWFDGSSGNWVTSTYYRSEVPDWVRQFNDDRRIDKYLGVEWKDAAGKVLRPAAPKETPARQLYQAFIASPFGNDYEFEFARDLISRERLGSGTATDLLIISLSANDILGHQVGPDSEQMHAMALAQDRQLADFFSFVGRQIGLANVWLALSADHGVSALPSYAHQLRIPAIGNDADKLRKQLNATLSARFSPGHPAEFVREFDYPVAWLDEAAFNAANVKEPDAEKAVGEAMKQLGLYGYFTRAQLARGEVAADEMGTKYLHSYVPLPAWYVLGVPAPYNIGSEKGTDHASPYTYDTHVPLAFYGLAFRPGLYRTHAEPVDLAVTLASLLGINAPSAAVGRVLTEALAAAEPFNRTEVRP